jgi:hypothetical protein
MNESWNREFNPSREEPVQNYPVVTHGKFASPNSNASKMAQSKIKKEQSREITDASNPQNAPEGMK